ncbi:S66 peptidase family protein [Ammoniphilus resinae]|uniref:Muramoyltetrapeptide carboxypeptidase n=1 Tax=Ammoniphilus resinae TaxID=861532 RepID=A0ABS4GSA9_9BACL|nr:LD-carboxypeptidase [Ammoniphilus resinae]MBP1933165.1 muramoyltetrapeptide carboxypeptidase [Ammoniphilus resinae]
MSIIKPKALQHGGTIAVIAPASPVPEEQLEKSVDRLARFGFRVILGESVRREYGYLSGRDDIRAMDVNRMFADPDVDAIICLRGGYGTPRILDQLDYPLICKNPKIFIGYSDITALHQALHRSTGLVTFHGPMVSELAVDHDELNWPLLFKLISETDALGKYSEPPGMFQYQINNGVASGRLVGGNLSLLVSLLGTPYEVDPRGRILFIEDVGEQPYKIDRMLTQLRLAGKLEQAEGILFTDFSGIHLEPKKPSLSVREVLEDIISPLGIPSYYGLKAGHCQPNLTLPIGIKARLDAVEGTLELLESCVI